MMSAHTPSLIRFPAFGQSVGIVVIMGGDGRA